jgi:hypothetical protein
MRQLRPHPERITRRLHRWDPIVRELLRGRGGLDAFGMLLRYVLKSKTEIGTQELRTLAVKYLGRSIEEEFVSIEAGIFERGMSKGISKGVSQGISQGVVLGQRSTLLTQLGVRFGELPAEISDRVEAAEGPLLDRWTRRVVVAATLAEVFADP